MLLRRPVLEAIKAGRVDLAFRRWQRPRVLAGTQMRTPIGLVEIVHVEVVARGTITEADARRAGFGSVAELLDMLDSRDEGEIYRLELRYAGADPRVELRERADLGSEDLRAISARLERLDRAARAGAWTRTVLELIRERPAVRAPDLAAALGRETQPFKRDVRKLKELGLTESLETGYRLSPRGRVVLEHLGGAPEGASSSARSARPRAPSTRRRAARPGPG